MNLATEAEQRNDLSFEAYVVPHYNECVVLARKLCSNDRARAGDIVQTTMLRALRAWPTFVPRPDVPIATLVKSWLYRIVGNVFVHTYDHECVRRRDADHVEEITALAHGYGCTTAEENDLRTHVDSPAGDEVRAALDLLTTDHRAVMELHYLQGIPCEQIAEILGIPKNTVFTRVSRAKRALRPLLGDYAKREYRIGLQESEEDAGEPEPNVNPTLRVVCDENMSAVA